jgi:hypothetical protein
MEMKPDNLPEVCAFAEICRSYKGDLPTCNRQESFTFCGFHKRAIAILNKRYRSLDFNLFLQKINEADEFTKRIYPSCSPANRTLDEISKKLGELRVLLGVADSKEDDGGKREELMNK